MSQEAHAGRRYRILEVVGRGGFGTVYRAEMIGAGGFTKQVAIKVLHGDGDAPREMLGRLRDEARILGLLRHRAIVGVDSLALFDQGWAVVMEYVPGVDLGSVISSGPVPPRVALELVEEAASALHAAYEMAPPGHVDPLRLVHRDIKPSNIRVTAQGEVKVLDFGVARADFSAREAHTSNYLFGSLKYMAIERLEGVESPAADIYALGLVLAELLVGRDLPEPPRQAERFSSYVDDLLEDVIAAVHEDPFQSTEGPVAGLVELIRGMLSDDHESRPTAAKVERVCRSLRQGSQGVWLRDWAALEVPRLVAEHTVVERSADSGSVLVERSSSLAASIDVGVEEPGDERAFVPRALLWGVLGGALLGLVGLGGVLMVLRSESPLTIPEPVTTQPPSRPVAPEPAQPEPAPAAVEPPAPEPSPEEPAPAPTPAPPRPQPEPVRVEPPPAPPAEPVAWVELTGDARSVWLISESGRYPVGAVPPGSYEIKAWFDRPDPAVAGSITLHDGERVTLRCIGAMARCARAD